MSSRRHRRRNNRQNVSTTDIEPSEHRHQNQHRRRTQPRHWAEHEDTRDRPPQTRNRIINEDGDLDISDVAPDFPLDFMQDLSLDFLTDLPSPPNVPRPDRQGPPRQPRQPKPSFQRISHGFKTPFTTEHDVQKLRGIVENLYNHILETALDMGVVRESEDDMDWQPEPTTQVYLVRTVDEVACYPDGSFRRPWE